MYPRGARSALTGRCESGRSYNHSFAASGKPVAQDGPGFDCKKIVEITIDITSGLCYTIRVGKRHHPQGETIMMKPRNIAAVETEETKALSAKAFAALNDKALTDDQADAIVAECNRQQTALGMPATGLTVSRAAYRAAYPTFNI
jgi:hypothetical protein